VLRCSSLSLLFSLRHYFFLTPYITMKLRHYTLTLHSPGNKVGEFLGTVTTNTSGNATFMDARNAIEAQVDHLPEDPWVFSFPSSKRGTMVNGQEGKFVMADFCQGEGSAEDPYLLVIVRGAHAPVKP
jgi:hypothetical protein